MTFWRFGLRRTTMSLSWRHRSFIDFITPASRCQQNEQPQKHRKNQDNIPFSICTWNRWAISQWARRNTLQKWKLVLTLRVGWWNLRNLKRQPVDASCRSILHPKTIKNLGSGAQRPLSPPEAAPWLRPACCRGRLSLRAPSLRAPPRRWNLRGWTGGKSRRQGQLEMVRWLGFLKKLGESWLKLA